MLALSIKQPWTWLIVQGYKPVENRTWPTTYRGLLLLHAGKQLDCTFDDVFQDFGGPANGFHGPGVPLPQEDTLPRGGIVGIARLVDCVRHHPSPWFVGPWGFVLAEVRPLPFLPIRGQLGLFPVPDAWLQASLSATEGML